MWLSTQAENKKRIMATQGEYASRQLGYIEKKVPFPEGQLAQTQRALLPDKQDQKLTAYTGTHKHMQRDSGSMFYTDPAGRKQRRKAAWLDKMDARILHTNGANFTNTNDANSWRQPMLLNAWTQTTGEDFELLRSLDNDPQLQAENRALLDKVRYLESKLQEHTELLSQIHATSARMQMVTGAAAAPPTVMIPITHQPQILTPPSSVICAPFSSQTQPQRAEVIDYKIIAAAGADCSDADAIEIRLAAESLNSLSSSADSDRLEICLDEQQQIKREILSEQMPPKRRKLKYEQVSPMPAPLQQQQIQHNIQYKLPTRRSNGIKLKEEPDKGDVKGHQLADNVMVSIGPNNTCVPASVFENINWSCSSLATRKLLVGIFDRETLATHSMTGKPSPAFKHKPLKRMLDPSKIQDIIFAVTRKSNASEKEVRNAITTKCADENKMMKIQKGKRCSAGDKENMLKS